jgi:dephospho-CoA kinase
VIEVGITGGIGSGKSIVCEVFRSLGVPIYDADSRAKFLMENDEALISSIKDAFSLDAYLDTGKINRAFLAKSAFASEENTQKINSIVHPVVAGDYSNWVLEQNSPYVIKEAALLIESGSYQQLDKLIVVTAPVDLRIKRVKSRDPFRDEAEIAAIIDKQLSDQERKDKADFILKNDESELLIIQVLKLDEYFKQFSK